jgi:ferric-dicitrate binding protein FerR (iron transport regulator)
MGVSSSHRLRELFDRYLRRGLTPAEVEELVSLLGRADAEAALSEPMARIWEELKSRPVEHRVDWGRMYRQVSQSVEGFSVTGERVSGVGRRRVLWSWQVVGAVFLGLAGLAAYWSLAYRRPVVVGARMAAVAKKDSVGSVGAMSWQTAANKKVIHLPDGSMVILNKHSMLEYKGAGGRRAR